MEEEERTIEEIAATIAHEVKNPLALLQGYIDLLEAGDKVDSHTASYAKMRGEIQRINELMLDFTYLTMPRDTAREIVDIADTLADTVLRYKPVLPPGVELTLIRTHEACGVQASKKELEVVFSNLLKNALESVGDSGWITAEVGRDGDTAAVTVTDDGIGILQGTESEILRMFYTTKPKGSGLGLYICTSIVKTHNGEITVKNNPEGGVTVKVSLPIII